ncbi:hypothetical protein BGZ63DRAFT_127608 [Mariannaea sp. PMI_226]|nr:hypothetical protein BGZ63DRAFT_127608 [Mariannaea sp. PMI_226]
MVGQTFQSKETDRSSAFFASRSSLSLLRSSSSALSGTFFFIPFHPCVVRSPAPQPPSKEWPAITSACICGGRPSEQLPCPIPLPAHPRISNKLGAQTPTSSDNPITKDLSRPDAQPYPSSQRTLNPPQLANLVLLF